MVEGDGPSLHPVFSDPEVMRYYPAPFTEELYFQVRYIPSTRDTTVSDLQEGMRKMGERRE
ncbi:hypothetical protein KNP414_03253 [Paenibacillus mucilaginosus KNP414]|uniref:Uncharacterized protein n=1 Tax=Paenibacillus mucilaginosus (strain KNP414) TaxID=1036673 RepID=F8FF93_PAEMK|nr:hypothetical protein KNP414_03253 [Paenibacillus mucilaginosus KNP414]